MADWQALTYAKTEQDFEDGYMALRAKYFHQPLLIQYVHENKYPKRHLFTKAWTSQVHHLGHTVTSRVESGHSKFKLWLGHNRPVMLLDWRPFWIGLDRSNWISLFAPELNLARQSLDQIRKCPSSGLDWIESPIQLQSNPITSLLLIR